MERAVAVPFDLEAGPLVRAECCRSGRGAPARLHRAHIVCDGWSFGVIVKDLAGFYSARLGKGESRPLADSFAEYSVALAKERRLGASSAPMKPSGCRSTRLGARLLDLPGGSSAQGLAPFASRRVDVNIDAETTAGIRKWGAKQGASLSATLTTAFAIALNRIAAAPSRCRRHAGRGPVRRTARTVSSVIASTCCRCASTSIRMRRSRPLSPPAARSLLDALDHQKYTFGTLLRKLATGREPGRVPLVSVLFNVDQPLDESTVNFGGLGFEFGANPRVAENFEIFVNAVPTQKGLRFEVQFNSDLFDDATIRRWFGVMESVLRAALVDGNQKVGRVNLLTDAASR